MKVLVTGATGYVGSAVRDALRLAAHHVSDWRAACDRKPSWKRGYEAARRPDDLDLLRAAAAGRCVITASYGPSGRRQPRRRRALLGGSKARASRSSTPRSLGLRTHAQHGREVYAAQPAHVAWRPAVEELVLASKPTACRARCCARVVYGRRGGRVAAMFRDAREHGAVNWSATARTIGRRSTPTTWPSFTSACSRARRRRAVRGLRRIAQPVRKIAWP